MVLPRWLVPVRPAGQVLTEHALCVRDGRIVDLLPAPFAQQRYRAARVLHLPEHVVAPGLVNAHTHAAMSLLRGLADDLPLMTWLNEHIWPAEQQHVDEVFCVDGVRLAIAEMIAGGTTCFNDMYFFPEATAREAAAAGIRAVVGLIVLDFPSAWAGSADEYLHRGVALHDAVRDEPLVTTVLAPHAPYTVSDAPLRRVRSYAAELGIGIHMHVHETAAEVEQAVAADGRRPLERLEALGLLGPELIAVHMTQLSDEEIARCAEAGVSVVHCPESNLKLASGICPVPRLLAAGVNVALGTDGAASNNDLDMLGEMRTAALLAKGASGDPTALPAAAALEMATLGGARALGLDEQIGSLEVGKFADFIAVDLSAPNTQPVYDPVSQLVYAAGREQVTHSFVAGRALMENRRLLTIDDAAAVLAARRHAEAIRPCP